ncbi:uncharacterized membrane protein YcaP (DUF421 family) [Evansella vedderi]|uniref:Uncharacterized membrane protein YcaP (DUF421 family) n=1 Tax=Evansella vedderi TaxID=38282 RepID=A0ABT9ZV15_9BACI|nr:DUF421 domain-containing protein [Evansella vedderi]MDQ0253975.1 uncharacterized membrane protein YcaP (DUF421 family) [Evansella vedderi]
MPGWFEVVIRSAVALVILLLLSKGIIRKPLAQMTYFEFVSAIVLAAILAIGSINLQVPIAYPIMGIIIWGAVPYLMEWLSMKSLRFRNFLHGRGIPVIKDGKILEDNLKKQRLSSDELLKSLRSKNVFQVADVEFAVLETSGDISVLPKKDYQPLTPKDLNLKVAPIKEPETVIMDGKVLDEPLSTIGYNRQWLEVELEKIGVAIENVYLGQVDSYGQLTVDLFDDKLKVPSPQEKPLLLSTIKKCQADLEAFALATDNQEAKQMYAKNAKEMDRVLKKISPYLQ